MSITLDDLSFLNSQSGGRVLERLAGEDLADDRTLPLLTALRRDLTAQQAGAALELAQLRQKAVAKFGGVAARMFFTREALEQASDPLIRAWRATLIEPGAKIVDVCCGIGGDALAFAAAGQHVAGLDIDPLRVALARLNAAVLGLDVQFRVADVREGVPKADLIFFDPARRDDAGRRIFHVEGYQPPLSTIYDWQAQRIMVKLSPGVNWEQLTPYVDDGAAVCFASVEGDLKEALLFEGFMPSSIAVLLSGGEVHYWKDYAVFDAPISQPRGWLVEPDPAIIRAGLVADAAVAFGGAQLDSQIAYITSDEKPVTPWARSWKIIDWMPFNVKALRAYLRERNVGQVTVKKRGTAVTPEDLIARLKLNGNGSRTIVLTRCRGEHITLVCEDLTIERDG